MAGINAASGSEVGGHGCVTKLLVLALPDTIVATLANVEGDQSVKRL